MEKSIFNSKKGYFEIEIDNSNNISIPVSEIFDIIEWIEHLPFKLGTGKFNEYYESEEGSIEISGNITFKYEEEK